MYEIPKTIDEAIEFINKDLSALAVSLHLAKLSGEDSLQKLRDLGEKLQTLRNAKKQIEEITKSVGCVIK